MHAPIPILIVSDRFRDCNRGTCETKAPLSNRTQAAVCAVWDCDLHLYTAGVRRSEWKQKIRFTFRPDFAIITPAEYAPVAQLDRVTDSDSVGQRFESARAYHKKPAVRQVFLLCAADSRFIPGRGNPLGRTTKKPAVRQVFCCAPRIRGLSPRGEIRSGVPPKNPVVSMAAWFFFVIAAVNNQAQFRLFLAIKCPVMLHQCCTKN